MTKVVIVGAARTAMGGFQGAFSGVPAAVLGGAAIRAALGSATCLGRRAVDGLRVACGPRPSAGASGGLAAGLSDAVPATTLNKMCGSGMKTAMIAHDQIALGQTQMMVAGGMESMSDAPYLLPKMRGGARLGHAAAIDHMFLDGLEDAYDKGRLMGTFAEDCAQAFQFTRADQDAYALASLTRALGAQAAGALAAEITPVTVTGRKGDVTVGPPMNNPPLRALKRSRP